MSKSSFPEGQIDSASSVLFVRDAEGEYRAADGAEIVRHAREVLARKVHQGDVMSAPGVVKDYMRLQFAALEHEVFAVLFVDALHRVLAFDEMFRGTVTQTSVYPREVVKRSLKLNAVAVILAHNHPSGSAEPSRADQHLTQCLKTSLALVDVRVIDHLVVGADDVVSFAERGLL